MRYFSLLFILLSLKFSIAQKFVEVSNEKGIGYNYPGNDYQEVGAGVTIIDVNNDGWDDIFQSGGVFASKLWLNEKGKFVDATSQFGFDVLDHHFIQATVAADVDNDGFEDLFICNLGDLMNMGDCRPPVLMKNIKGERFEIAYVTDFNETGSYPGAAWGDINNDGFVDLYVLNYVHYMGNGYDSIKDNRTYIPYCNKNLVYLNQGGIAFEEMGEKLGLNDDGCGLAVSFTDFDNDNDVDIFMLNDFGSWNHLGNRLFRNDYPEMSFTDVSVINQFDKEFYGMGVGTGDIDNDGWFDYYLTNIGRNYFYHNKNGQLQERAHDYKLDDSFVRDSTKGTSWSGLFFDVENDGDVDLYVTKGYLNSLENVTVKDNNRLYLNSNARFDDVGEISGINDSLAHRGAATFDFDHDGDLDIVSSVIKMQQGDLGGLDQKIKLFENQTESKNNWIGIKLIGGDGVNKSCIGCRVSFEIDGKIYMREVDGGSGHGCQNSRILYFGIGTNKQVKNIQIHWLGQETSTIKKLKKGRVYSVDRGGTIKVVY